MPTYDYLCKKTGKTFELFQQMTDAPLTKCPECGGPVKRLIGAGGGILVRGSTSGGANAAPCGDPRARCGECDALGGGGCPGREE